MIDSSNFKNVKFGEFLKMEVVVLNKQIAKQLKIIYSPSRDQFERMTIAGFIARDALESGSREVALVVYEGSWFLVPMAHLTIWKDKGDLQLTQIFLK